MANQGRHWLVEVARRAKLPGADRVSLDCGKATREAWVEVCTASGVSEDELARVVAAHFRLSVANLKAVEAKALKA